MSRSENFLSSFSKAYSLTGKAKMKGIKDYVHYMVDSKQVKR